jgi:hypothetical protein
MVEFVSGAKKIPKCDSDQNCFAAILRWTWLPENGIDTTTDA